MKTLKKIAFGLLVALILLFCLFPFYYAVLTSFETGTAIFTPSYQPDSFSLAKYTQVLGRGFFPRNVLNSVLVASVTVVLSLGLGVTAAFALARIRFRGRKLLLLTVLSVSMFPQIAVLSGLFEIVRALGLYNTLGSLVMSYMIFTLPFTVWVLTTFMRGLPIEIEEAAIIDGAGPLHIVLRVFLPLLWPALVTTGLLAFIQAWNEFLFALTFVSSNDTRTAPVAIALISGTSARETPWGAIMAASVVVTVPLIILVLIFQRRIVAGFTAGGVKG
jgi:trehalose/maltose transport system permease protein